MYQRTLTQKAITVGIGGLVALFATGCGGGGRSGPDSTAISSTGDATGTVRLLIRWPTVAADSRAIPAGTESVSVVVLKAGSRIANETANRPVGDASGTSEVTLKFLPIGPANLQVRAHDGPNATGSVLASKEALIEVRPGPNDTVHVALDAVSPPVEDDKYVIGGSVSPDPSDPSKILITLNALIAKADGQPLNGLTASNFRVYEDDIERPVASVTETGGGAPTSRADIGFVIDVTGSMDEQIAGVRSSVVSFARALASEGVDVQLGGIAFRDAVEETFDLTADVESFVGWVEGLWSSCGGDGPEDDLDAIMAGLDSLTWRVGSQHMLVVITDAPTHYGADGSGYTERTVDEVRNALVAASVVCHTVSPQGIAKARSAANGPSASARSVRASYPDVSVLANATGGIAMLMPDDGIIDLSSLPLREIVLSGYIVTFSSYPAGSDHNIRLIVRYDGEAVADKEFSARY